MKINKNENVVLVDVDGTLIVPTGPDTALGVAITLDYYGIKKQALPHKAHIELLKSYKERGFFIRVHSNNGWKWAHEVVTKLCLNDYVDEIESKPCRFIDDELLASNDVIGQRVFIAHKS